MTELKCLSWLLTCTSLICFCNCQDNTMSVIQKLDQFQEELLDTKFDSLRMEKRILNIIDDAKASLRNERKENIRDQVREAMAEILQGESLQDMVKSQVNTELRPLKQGYHQMKSQVHHVTRSLKDFQEETTAFHDTILEKAKTWNETCQFKISQQNAALSVPASSPVTANDTSTTRLPVSTTSVTTPKPEEKKSRLLIAPLWSSTQHQFRQLNIHSNSLSVYQYLNMKNVASVAYIAKTKKLLIGLDNPDKIVSSTLDTSHVTVLKEGVDATGMVVDEDRDIVFVSTYQPRHSINRMSTQGKDFTAIIDLSKYGSSPRQLTLDTRRKMIYGCNGRKLFTVTYDGQGLATLATGSSMYAVTLDQTAGVLYYNNEKKLMKMTVSNNVSTEVTTLNVVPYTMRLYRGTIYYSGVLPTLVGAVNVTYNIGAYNLYSINMKGASAILLCLIP
ncbi:uncharacterized protein [Haliotis cracherodii]|uniref:uncharacterized protein n=1 Tax=Haliotis cracherodii TaxID=6455 RepID=UPI0039EBA737